MTNAVPKRSLTDILNGGGGNFGSLWNSTDVASEFGPVPPGSYICHATKGELESSRAKLTPGYKLEFTSIEGEFKGRKFWLDLWLTPAALPHSKRDFAKLGIVTPEQLELPLPRGIRCKVKVVLRTRDDGSQFNSVKSFEFLGIDQPEVDPFAPPQGDAAEPIGDTDTSFNPDSFDERGAA